MTSWLSCGADDRFPMVEGVWLERSRYWTTSSIRMVACDLGHTLSDVNTMWILGWKAIRRR